MLLSPYQRTVEQLAAVASRFWPDELSEQAAELSIIPKLIETQETFIRILSIPVYELEGLFEIIDTSTMPSTLFLKHLVVLSDFGGENLKRISSGANLLFPNNKLTYLWESDGKAQERTYSFKRFPSRRFSNETLGLTGQSQVSPQKLSDLQKDAIAILLLGATSTEVYTANVLSKCEISAYLGQPDKLDRFIRQRYIWVSGINAGSKSNTLGQLAQKYVHDYLREHLTLDGVTFTPNGHIPGVSHAMDGDSRLTTFDLVVGYRGKFVAIEISFQVTTNSVIERKAGQAQARYRQIHAQNSRIAYVLDGAGNLERESALRTLCAYSDCSVAFSLPELKLLAQFMIDFLSMDNKS